MYMHTTTKTDGAFQVLPLAELDQVLLQEHKVMYISMADMCMHTQR